MLIVDISSRTPISLFRLRVSPQWLSRLRRLWQPRSLRFSVRVSSLPLATWTLQTDKLIVHKSFPFQDPAQFSDLFVVDLLLKCWIYMNWAARGPLQHGQAQSVWCAGTQHFNPGFVCWHSSAKTLRFTQSWVRSSLGSTGTVNMYHFWCNFFYALPYINVHSFMYTA